MIVPKAPCTFLHQSYPPLPSSTAVTYLLICLQQTIVLHEDGTFVLYVFSTPATRLVHDDISNITYINCFKEFE